MTRLLAVAGIGSLALIMLTLEVTAGFADGVAHHHRRHHSHVSYVEYVPAYGEACRSGWWQTLRYGHVRPKWRTWCR